MNDKDIFELFQNGFLQGIHLTVIAVYVIS